MKRYFATLVSRLILIAGQLLYLKIITRYLDISDLGVYYFSVTVSYFLSAVLFIPFDYYQQSKVFEVHRQIGSLAPLIRLNIGLLKKFSILSATCILLVALVFPKYLLLAVLVVALSLATYVPQAMRGALNILGHSGWVNISQSIDGVIKPASAWMVAAVGFTTANAMMFANVVTLLISIMVLGTFYKAANLWARERNSSHPIFQEIEIFKQTLPVSISALLNWVQLQGYRVVLVPLGYAEVVGVYSVMSNLGHSAMGAASAIYAQMRSPQLYRSAGTSAPAYLAGGAMMTIVLALFAWFFSPFLVPYVTNSGYVPYASLVPLGVLVEGGSLLLGGLMIYFTIISKTRLLALGGMFAAAVSMIGFLMTYCFSLVTPYSLGVVLVVSQLVAIFFLYRQYRKATEFRDASIR